MTMQFVCWLACEYFIISYIKFNCQFELVIFALCSMQFLFTVYSLRFTVTFYGFSKLIAKLHDLFYELRYFMRIFKHVSISYDGKF